MANTSITQAESSPPPGSRSRVLLVEDHPIVRRGLADVINGEPDLTVCAEAADAGQALEALAHARADAAIFDISLDGKNGIELLKEVKALYPELPVLVLSMYDESLYAERALRAGASGYVMKQEAIGNVLTALRRILAGQLYLSENLSSAMLRRAVDGGPATVRSPLEQLSDRELEVFHLIAKGLPLRQIAEKLYRSVKTIDAHREHIKAKLGLGSSGELLRYAIEHEHELERLSSQRQPAASPGAGADQQ